jgi:Type II site-specific deoxyribonuclease
VADSPSIIDKARLDALVARLPGLSASQFGAIENIIAQFARPHDFWRNANSDLVTECVLREFGDTLRIHHCFSAEAFTKDKFEFALEKVCNFCGIEAARSRRGNPGHDITLRGVPVSLKTQADASIRPGFIHISKFMELGKGQWGDKVADLHGLRDNFLHHMRNYARILTLRKLRNPGFSLYELVEIPKALLMEATGGTFEMRMKSKQFPKPGYCTVTDAAGKIRFQLYFDGGTERKLQIKHIDKALCVVHATWRFEQEPESEEGMLNPGVLDTL